MKELGVTIYPYATQFGTIKVPDELSPDNYSSYVEEHFSEINFGEPDLDYAGVDMEISEE